MTRRVEFSILTSRVIRLQGKRSKKSLRHIGTIKVKASIFGGLSCVRFAFLMHFREGIFIKKPLKKYDDPSITLQGVESRMSEYTFFVFFGKND